jgi:hypothetical protein
MKNRSLWLSSMALVAGLAFMGSAHATWTFTGTGTADGLGDGGTKATTAGISGGSGAPTLGISGAFALNGTGNAAFASGAKWITSMTGTTNPVTTGAQLNFYSGSGLGMASDSATAGIDNSGNTEAIMLSFSSSVVLTSIGINACDKVTNKCGGGSTTSSYDADVSLFRYTGAGTPASMNGVASDLTGMALAGWALVSNYANLQGVPTPDLVNAGAASSSYWLISAYNSSYGTGTGLTQGDDCFELAAVSGTLAGGGNGTGTGGSVPEPTSVARAALGLFGATRVTRRRTAHVAIAAA